jgi:hypothetical protein
MMNKKKVERTGHGHSWHSLEGTEERHQKEAGLLTTQVLRLVEQQ